MKIQPILILFLLVIAGHFLGSPAMAGDDLLVNAIFDNDPVGAPPRLRALAPGSPLEGPTLLKATEGSTITVEGNYNSFPPLSDGKEKHLLVFKKVAGGSCVVAFEISPAALGNDSTLTMKALLLLSKANARGNVYISLAAEKTPMAYVQVGANGNISVTEFGARTGNERFSNLPLDTPVEIELCFDFSKGEMSMTADGVSIFSEMAFDAALAPTRIEIGSVAMNAQRELALASLSVADEEK